MRYSVFSSKKSDYPNHSFVRIRDTDTGQTWITRAGPSSKDLGGFIVHKVTGTLTVKAETTSESKSYDTAVIKDKNKEVGVVATTTLPGVTGADVANQATDYSNAMNKDNALYDENVNSNSYAFGAYDKLTGTNLPADPSMPGSGNRIPDATKPTPDTPPKGCQIMVGGTCQ